mmetsp:Transcript_19267/g.39612  ORF Transcript_19267/g.39612 Transcript_19267/m.39612 type:complete len:85 (+) Transcript_19267:153-407(+)
MTIGAFSKLLKEATANQQMAAPFSHPPGKQRRPLDPKGYFWRHGFRVSFRHGGYTCTTPAEGHKKEAKRGNTMGGSRKGVPKKL